MYNRYIPQGDGTYQRSRLPESRPPRPPRPRPPEPHRPPEPPRPAPPLPPPENPHVPHQRNHHATHQSPPARLSPAHTQSHPVSTTRHIGKSRAAPSAFYRTCSLKTWTPGIC
ncbi:MAG: hypothetical protein ACLU9S_11110 [Oscillospiraceae bacterium]